ncbi:hypothetical protein SDC9_178288 [bioreactor metagenome]|uniref:Uncharacterized protein n=1 Tax=bioreactor metagenome TaxID=1076179 RepID=A0A645GVX6_9ZZZZ
MRITDGIEVDARLDDNRFVESEPIFDTVGIAFEGYFGIFRIEIDDMLRAPAIVFLHQIGRDFVMLQAKHRLDSGFKQCIHDITDVLGIVFIDYRIFIVRKEARPVDRRPVMCQTDFFHQSHIFVVAVIE